MRIQLLASVVPLLAAGGVAGGGCGGGDGRGRSQGGGSHITEYHAVGTAGVAGGPVADDLPSKPAATLSLKRNG